MSNAPKITFRPATRADAHRFYEKLGFTASHIGMKKNLKTENTNIVHNQTANRFEMAVDGHLAVLEYVQRGERITFTHTIVPHAIEGRGIGSKLVETGLNYARENGMKVKSLCWFVSKYIRQHPEYESLLQ